MAWFEIGVGIFAVVLFLLYLWRRRFARPLPVALLTTRVEAEPRIGRRSGSCILRLRVVRVDPTKEGTANGLSSWLTVGQVALFRTEGDFPLGLCPGDVLNVTEWRPRALYPLEYTWGSAELQFLTVLDEEEPLQHLSELLPAGQEPCAHGQSKEQNDEGERLHPPSSRPPVVDDPGRPTAGTEVMDTPRGGQIHQQEEDHSGEQEGESQRFGGVSHNRQISARWRSA